MERGSRVMKLVRDENYEQCRLIIKVLMNTPITVYTPLGRQIFVDFSDSYGFEKEFFDYIESGLRADDPIFDFEMLEILIDELDIVLQNRRIFTTYEDRKELIDGESTFGDYLEKLSWKARELRLE